MKPKKRKRHPPEPPREWDGMCVDAAGQLWTPAQMQKWCQRRMDFLENDPRAAYLRKQDEEAKRPPRWWEKQDDQVQS
jgi:hypothetical protein